MFQNLYYYVLDLASKSNNNCIKLQAYAIQIYFNGFIMPNPAKALAIVEKAYPMYLSVFAQVRIILLPVINFLREVDLYLKITIWVHI
jgi:hypothetical protein